MKCKYWLYSVKYGTDLCAKHRAPRSTMERDPVTGELLFKGASYNDCFFNDHAPYGYGPYNKMDKTSNYYKYCFIANEGGKCILFERELKKTNKDK